MVFGKGRLRLVPSLAALGLIVGLAAPAAAGTPLAVRIVVDVEENGWSEGWNRLAAGSFTMTGDLEDEGWAGASIGWGAQLSLQGDAGSLSVDVNGSTGTWAVTGSDGAYAGLTGGGAFTWEMTPIPGPGGSTLYAHRFVLDGLVEIVPPPSVALTGPASGSTVSGTAVTLAATAENAERVEFLVDGVRVGADSTSPHVAVWDSTTVADGTHTITAVARDAWGRTASDAAMVTVSNPEPPPDDEKPKGGGKGKK